MRIKIALGLLATGMCTSVALAAPSSMVQMRAGSVAVENVVESTPASNTGGGKNWLTKWWGKPSAKPAAVAVAPVAPPTYQPAAPPSAAYPAGMTPARLPALSASHTSPTAPGASSAVTTSVDQVLAQAQAAEGHGQVDLARQMLTQCISQNPSNCLARRRLGHLEDRAGRLAEAEQHYRQAIGCNPTSAAAVNDLGLCLARQGRLDQSLATFQQAITMRPEKPLYRNNVATVLVQLGQIDDALDHLNACNEPAVASYNLGHLLLKADKPIEAAEQFRQALAIDATLIPAQSALQRLDVSAPANFAQMTPPQMMPAADVDADDSPSDWSDTPTMPPRVAAAPMAAEPAPAGAFPRLLPPVIER